MATVRRWNRVTVVGCGLIGASFALALRLSGACERIAGWDLSSSALHDALERGIIDEIDDAFASEKPSDSDLFYLAVPVQESIRFIRESSAQIKPGALITDAGSTKAQVCRAARESLSADRFFIGGHPIAGSHHSGSRYARSDLFKGAPYALIKDDETDEKALLDCKELAEILGARVVLMQSSEHDRAMAFISHLPQLLSSALAATVDEQSDAGSLIELAGSGYRDMTRLAASSWDMWEDILASNSDSIAHALSSLIEKLAAVRVELHGCSERADSGLAFSSSLFRKSL